MKRQRGFTLIEVIIFIVIVSVGVAGILSVFQRSVQSSADPMVRKQTLAIAESLLEEIMLKEFTDPDGTNTGETGRANWDNVLDYNGYTTVGKSVLGCPPSSGGIEDATGAGTSGLCSYNVQSVVVAAATAPPDNASLVAVGALRVTVNINGPQGLITLVGYRAAP